MINEKKVILMTKLQAFEDGEGKKEFPILKYFRSDYISLQLLKGIVAITVCAIIVFGLWVCCNLEDLLDHLNTMDYKAFVTLVASRYGIGLLIYLAVVYVYSAVTYTRARRAGKKYHRNLKALKKM